MDNSKELIIGHLKGKGFKYIKDSLILAAHLGASLIFANPIEEGQG